MPNRAKLAGPSTIYELVTLALMGAVAGCGGGALPVTTLGSESARSPQARADGLLALYDPIYVALYRESARASWAASTNVNDHNTGLRTGADTAMSAFTGNAEIIRRARELLQDSEALSDITTRQLRAMLYLAASAPQTNPDLARRRIAAESRQSALLDGFQFCLERQGEQCTSPITTNDIDEILRESGDLDERARYWNASKEVGPVLRDGLMDLRDLRNGVAREMGYRDFFSFQVDDYGMTAEEMVRMLDRLIVETRPLFVQLHCWTRHELVRRFGASEAPRLIPAHWIGNRWAQSWPGLIEGIDRDALVEGRTPEWIVQQAERFYVSMGFPHLPQTFWELSDLYPVPEGETREKNDHASAWSIDLDRDVRSLMSVEANWDWFGTTHHELGHIYYDLAYARPEVPPLLRRGANRAYHEAIGTLIELPSSQDAYLREIGLMTEGQAPEQIRVLMDHALTGPIVFLPFAAGTMSQFEKALYADDLSAEQLQSRWWELVARYQGVSPPAERPATGCDACTKTHINDDPGQYYDYALSEVILYQLHDHICRQLLHEDPHSCNYYNRPEVGAFLQSIMRVGATRDWQELLREVTGRELTAEPMLEYYRPLLEYLEAQNRGRSCDWLEAGGEPSSPAR